MSRAWEKNREWESVFSWLSNQKLIKYADGRTHLGNMRTLKIRKKELNPIKIWKAVTKVSRIQSIPQNQNEFHKEDS